MTENELLEQVRRRAAALGLLVSHHGDSRRDIEYTPGRPDLIIVSPAGRGILYAELKSDGGQLSSAQRRWRYALGANQQPWVLWRPADWASGEIQARLQLLGAP